jgi:hypothetical protein
MTDNDKPQLEPESTEHYPVELYHEGYVPVRLGGFRDALAFADQLIKSRLLPKHIDTPQKALAVILTGQEMGLPPMRSLRHIHVIGGNPVMKAELLLALFRERGGKAKQVESTDDICEWLFTHPNGDEHTERLTWEEAEARGYSKTKSGALKDNWAKNPGRRVMLRWRVIANGTRVAGPDLVGGAYIEDELDYVPRQEPTVDLGTTDDLNVALQAKAAEVTTPASEAPTEKPKRKPAKAKADADWTPQT